MGRLIDADKLIQYWLTPPMSVGWDDVIEDVNNQPTVEAIPKADYEARLKADMLAMLAEIQLQFENGKCEDMCDCWRLIQNKINKVKGEKR